MGRHVDLWLEGWRRGDAGLILGAVTDDFVHDDPVDRHFTRADFVTCLEELFATGCTPDGYETISDVITYEDGGEETTWGWWRTLGAPHEGAGLVKARRDGVYLERVACYSIREAGQPPA